MLVAVHASDEHITSCLICHENTFMHYHLRCELLLHNSTWSLAWLLPSFYVWFVYFQQLKEKARQSVAKKIEPYQKIIESYGYKWMNWNMCGTVVSIKEAMKKLCSVNSVWFNALHQIPTAPTLLGLVL